MLLERRTESNSYLNASTMYQRREIHLTTAAAMLNEVVAAACQALDRFMP